MMLLFALFMSWIKVVSCTERKMQKKDYKSYSVQYSHVFLNLFFHFVFVAAFFKAFTPEDELKRMNIFFKILKMNIRLENLSKNT